MSVRLKGTSRSGTADECSDQLPLLALMWRLEIHQCRRIPLCMRETLIVVSKIHMRPVCSAVCTCSQQFAGRSMQHTHTTVLLLVWNMSGSTRVSRYKKGKTRKGKTNLDLLEQEIVSGSGICWAICKSAPHADNNTNIPPLSFLQAGCPSCRSTNSIKALRERALKERAPAEPSDVKLRLWSELLFCAPF